MTDRCCTQVSPHPPLLAFFVWALWMVSLPEEWARELVQGVSVEWNDRVRTGASEARVGCLPLMLYIV